MFYAEIGLASDPFDFWKFGEIKLESTRKRNCAYKKNICIDKKKINLKFVPFITSSFCFTNL